MSPMPNECVLSYIYRINMVLAPCKMPNLFNKTGRWATFIKLPIQYQTIFLQNTDDKMFRLLLESGVIEYQKDILKSPVDYTKTMKTLLEGGKVKKNRGYQIKYCPKCIAEFIRVHGFAYFKANWSTFGAGHNCQLHQEPYNIIESRNKTDALQAVEYVMMGKRSRFCKSLRDLPYYRDLEDDFHFSDDTDEDLPHLASCLENKLKAWLLIDEHTFPDSLIRAVRSSNHGSLVRLMESNVFRDFMFKEAYSALHNSNYKKFHEFWKCYFESHTFYCGVIEKRGLKGTIAKLRGRNCSKCSDSRCPANLRIEPFRSYWHHYNDYKCPGKSLGKLRYY